MAPEFSKAEKRIVDTLAEHDQAHVLRWVEELSKGARRRLMQQLADVDFDRLEHFNALIRTPPTDVSFADVSPPAVARLPLNAPQQEAEQRVEKMGREALEANRVAIVTVAGGHGTRLGYDHPKGMCPITPIRGKSLFQLFAEEVLSARRRYSCTLPWLIMTSPSNDEFPACAACSAEYSTPADRRFHAQTISCPACGPSLMFLTPDGKELDEPLERTRRMLEEGRILAIKGIGGFHLACDATREGVVQLLRDRKKRPAKPLAIMVSDLQTCERLCVVSDFDKELLTSPQAPIVLLRKRPGCPVADAVAPGLIELGVMLPTAPLHFMLFEWEGAPPALVMTSCNRTEEPIAITHEDVIENLSDLVDGILTNNRRITNRCDDSVVTTLGARILPIRRARGYVPEPVMLDEEGPVIFATGGMMKNTFALTSGRRVFISQHIGDVSDADSAAFFARAFEEFSRLLRLEPEVVVCDMHPDYPTTDFARELCRRRSLPLIQVQQHHTHVVSCMAEHGHHGPVIGVAWDGSGYGEDGAVWGGELLIADRPQYERRYHLEYVPLPGGEQAVLNPCRMAVAHLARALGPEVVQRRMAPIMGQRDCETTLRVMEMPQFSPPTSSAGRLFDAVSALLGICTRSTYEGQPACELEAACDAGALGLAESAGGRSYDFAYDGPRILLRDVFRGIVEDLDARLTLGTVASAFHNTMARVIIETCLRLREESGIGTAALSGGVMQNRTLLGMVVPELEGQGFEVLLQTLVPANDAGLSLGQAACALARLA